MEKAKITGLLPSLKEDKRYLILLLKAEAKETAREQIENSILKFIGILGYAKANPMVIETGKKKENDYAILSINREYLEKVKVSLSLAGIRCIGVSGTVKKSRRFL